MRRSALCLMWTAGCIGSVPPERQGGALPFGAPVIARATMPAVNADPLGDPLVDPVADHLEDLQPIDRDRALLESPMRPRTRLSLWSASRGYVWSYEVERYNGARPSVLLDAGVVIVRIREPGGDAAIGLDLESGKERWRTSFPSADKGPIEPGHLADRGGPGRALHAHATPTSRTIVAFAPASGELGASLQYPQPGPKVHNSSSRELLRTRGHILLPDDPYATGRWTVLRRDDLAPVGHIDAGNNMCGVDDHLYFVNANDLTRVDLADPSLTPRRLDVPPSRMVSLSCDRHGDEDVLWYREHVLGIAPTGEVRWTIDLAGWEVEPVRWEDDVRPPRELPDRPVVAVRSTRQRKSQTLLGLDLTQHRVTWVAPSANHNLETFAVLHDRRRSYVQLVSNAYADQEASVIASFDGASGEVTAAVLVDGLSLKLTSNMLVDETLWAFAQFGGFAMREVELDAEGNDVGTDRRLAYGWLRLDGATLRPLDAPSGWALYDALPWWSVTMPRSEPVAAAATHIRD